MERGEGGLNWKQRKHRSLLISMPVLWLAVLALCFLGGVLLGQAVLARVPDGTGEELRRYLREFVALSGNETWSGATLFRALLLYLRYPLLAFLGGLTALGLLLVPCTAVAFGFFLSFAVCCFAATFGGEGILLALSLMGIRCAVTLPAFFLLAVPALERASELMLTAFGRGRRVRTAGQGKTYWLRFGVVTLLLLGGLCVDCLLSSWLLETALAGMTL